MGKKMHHGIQMLLGAIQFLRSTGHISSGRAAGAASFLKLFCCKGWHMRSAQIPLRFTKDAQNYWDQADAQLWPFPFTLQSQCRWEAEMGRGPLTVALHAGTAYPQGGIPLAGLNWCCCPIALCHRWRETGRYECSFSNQLQFHHQWWNCSFSFGRDGLGSSDVQFLGHIAALGELCLNLTAAVVRNGLISSTNFYLA